MKNVRFIGLDVHAQTIALTHTRIGCSYHGLKSIGSCGIGWALYRWPSGIDCREK